MALSPADVKRILSGLARRALRLKRRLAREPHESGDFLGQVRGWSGCNLDLDGLVQLLEHLRRDQEDGKV